jgi:hypothetical protein
MSPKFSNFVYTKTCNIVTFFWVHYNMQTSNCHDGYGIFVTKVTILVPLINNHNYYRATNVVRLFCLINIPLFCINIGSWQSNALKHNFFQLVLEILNTSIIRCLSILLQNFHLTLHKWSFPLIDKCGETPLANHGVVLSTIVQTNLLA